MRNKKVYKSLCMQATHNLKLAFKLEIIYREIISVTIQLNIIIIVGKKVLTFVLK